jgi:hypothetical protein
MPEDDNGSDKRNTSDKPARTNEREPVTGGNGSSASYVKQDSAGNRPHWADILMAVFTGLILLTYLTSDYFLWKQLGLTQTALGESENSFKQTLWQMQAQTKAAQDAASAASIQATNSERSLKATIDNFHLEQRAWVGLADALPPLFVEGGKRVYVKEGEEASFGFVITNSGRTPATNVVQGTSYIDLPRGTKFSPQYPGTNRAEVLQPNIRVWAMTPNTEPFTKPQVDGLKNGAYTLYVFGKVSYDDVFGVVHHTTFCMQLSRDLTGFSACPAYNTAD